MKVKLYKISAYLNEDELRQFKLFVKARGVTESAYIREMLGFDVRPRGAPKGPRKKKERQAKPATSKRARKEKGGRQSTAKVRMPQLPFPD